MKSIKYVTILVLISFLAACGHGFKGKWSDSRNNIVEIGSNYIADDDERTKLDKIYVKKIDGKKHLIFVADKNEIMKMEIVDKNTLLVKLPYSTEKITRVK